MTPVAAGVYTQRWRRSGQMGWNGTTEEKAELLAAVQHNCACRFNRVGLRISSCTPHQMLLNDQRALNGLLWNRHLLQRLLAEQGLVSAGGRSERE